MVKLYRKEKTLLVITLVLLALFWFGLCWPRIRLINKLKGQLADLEVLTENNLKLVNEMANFERLIERMKKDSIYLAESLRKKEDIPLLLNELSRISEKNDLKVVNIEALKPVTKYDIKGLGGLPIRLEVEGRFFSLGEFFKELDKSSLVASVDDLKIESDKEILPRVKAVMAITVYTLKEEKKP